MGTQLHSSRFHFLKGVTPSREFDTVCYFWGIWTEAAVLRAKPSVIIHEHDENSWQRLFTVLSHNKKKLKSHQPEQLHNTKGSTT